jgi:hypothetical protein
VLICAPPVPMGKRRLCAQYVLGTAAAARGVSAA